MGFCKVILASVTDVDDVGNAQGLDDVSIASVVPIS